jgi:GSH-dependent disulfide-bond oxidoreductase
VEAWNWLPHLKRLVDEINARPAAACVEELKGRHTFKTEMDEEARRFMFPQLARLAKSSAAERGSPSSTT